MSGELKCPYCLWPITEGETTETCVHCAARYHHECWVENKGCGTFGCPAWATTVTGGALAPPPLTAHVARGPMVVESVVTTVEPGTHFCDRCGQPVQPDDRFCGGCGNTL